MKRKKSCCVPLCLPSLRDGDGFSYHEIPCDITLRTKWLNNISRGDDVNENEPWIPSQRSLVCSRHFLPSDYHPTEKNKILKKEAIPTVFTDYPRYKQPKALKERRPLHRRNDSLASNNQPLPKRIKLFEQEKENIFPGNVTLTSATHPDSSSSPTNSKMIPDETSPNSFSPVGKVKRRDMLISAFEIKVAKLQEKLDMERAKNNVLQINNRKKQATISKLRQELQTKQKEDTFGEPLRKIQLDASNGDVKAEILAQQIAAYGKQRFRWSELCVRMCVLWRSKSRASYRFARSKFVNLPSDSTLQRYIGPSSLQTGLTDLAQLRLKEELTELNDQARISSLIFDEMAVQPRVQYNKGVDKIIGIAQFGNTNADSSSPQLANRLLCFVLKGLSTNYRIPVAYYLVKQITSEELSDLILKVVSQIEEIGYRICRLVCDDATVNVKALRLICGGNLAHQIPHPIRTGDLLFISFDACHILKNVKNQFLDNERCWVICGDNVTSQPIKMLYENHRSLPIRPVRSLNRKTLYPSNMEKMHVGRAVKLFSAEVIAALEFCSEKDLPGFRNLGATVTFMKNIKKWFEVHNVCNRTHHIVSRNEDKMEFWMLDDERLSWLQNDFLQYLDTWRENAPKSGSRKAVRFLTNETYTALKITTLSTVACIRYLIKSGFHYVLTRKFSSDDVEGIFSAVRSSQGYNDQATALGSIYALEKILKTGLFSSSSFGNSATETSDSLDYAFKNRNVIKGHIPEATTFELNQEQKKLVLKIRNPPRLRNVTAQDAGVGMVTGFLLRVLKNKNLCAKSCEKLSGTPSASVNGIIRLQDRGGLMYPSERLVNLVNLLLSILSKSTENLDRDALVKSWTKTLLPLIPISALVCGCGKKEHSLVIREIVVTRICKIYFNNVCETITDTNSKVPKYSGHTLSKKMKKL